MLHTDISRTLGSRLGGACRAVAAFALLVFAPLAAAATSPEPVRDWVTAEFDAVVWLDTGGQATAEAARAALGQGHGTAWQPGSLLPLGQDRAVWIALHMPAVATASRAVLTLPFPGLDRVELHRPDGRGGWTMAVAGDSIPITAWPLRHLHPAFVFNVQPGEGASYLRIQHSNPIALQWSLQNAARFNEEQKRTYLLLGALIGVVVIVVFVCLFNAYAWREWIHVEYALQVILLGLTLSTLNGVAGEFLWPDNAWWTDLAPMVVPLLTVGWLAQFTRDLVAERGDRHVELALLAVSAGSVVIAVYLLACGRVGPVLTVMTLFMLAGLVTIVAILAWHARRHWDSGRWILAGVALLLLGALFPLLRNLEVLPVSFVTQNAAQIAWICEIPLVLAGLHFHSRGRRDSRLRLQSLAHADPLTGLANHQQLCRTIDALLARARRDPGVGAVVRVRVGNLDRLRAEFGREAAETALIRAVECVAREAGQNDMLARERGGDIVVVLQGAVSRLAAGEAARNIIARGLKFTRLLPPTATLSLRVAIAAPPLHAADAEALLRELAGMLDEGEADGRPVRFSDAPGPLDMARGPVSIALADSD